MSKDVLSEDMVNHPCAEMFGVVSGDSSITALLKSAVALEQLGFPTDLQFAGRQAVLIALATTLSTGGKIVSITIREKDGTEQVHSI